MGPRDGYGTLLEEEEEVWSPEEAGVDKVFVRRTS